MQWSFLWSFSLHSFLSKRIPFLSTLSVGDDSENRQDARLLIQTKKRKQHSGWANVCNLPGKTCLVFPTLKSLSNHKSSGQIGVSELHVHSVCAHYEHDENNQNNTYCTQKEAKAPPTLVRSWTRLLACGKPMKSPISLRKPD